MFAESKSRYSPWYCYRSLLASDERKHLFLFYQFDSCLIVVLASYLIAAKKVLQIFAGNFQHLGSIGYTYVHTALSEFRIPPTEVGCLSSFTEPIVICYVGIKYLSYKFIIVV